MSLYDERRRTGVYGMKGEELGLTVWKKKKWSLMVERSRT